MSAPAWPGVALALLSACSTSATIRRSGGWLEARIVGSDAGALYVAGPRGGSIRLPREDVTEIDHPGNVLLLAGLGVLAWGAQTALTENQRGSELAATAAIIGLPGLAMLGWGGSAYFRSRSAASTFQDETVRLTTPDPNRPYLPAPTWPAP